MQCHLPNFARELIIRMAGTNLSLAEEDVYVVSNAWRNSEATPKRRPVAINVDGRAIPLIYCRGKLDESTVAAVAETHDLSLTEDLCFNAIVPDVH